MTKYDAFVKIVQTGSFTKAAAELGYTQSAVSQMLKSLEDELSATLIQRSKKGIALTPDGEALMPYIMGVHNACMELQEKKLEMRGLQSGLVRIGTFSSVSCNWLPSLIKDFKKIYPSVQFDLQQGEYTKIGSLVKEGSVDFGFVNPDAVSGLTVIPLSEDEMLAVLQEGHRLAKKEYVSAKELAEEPYILLDEGELSEPLNFFAANKLTPNIQYKVFDDYSIMSMVAEGLGISVLPKLVLTRHRPDIVTKPIEPRLVRTIALAYKDKSVLPIASRYFMDFILKKFGR